MAKPIHHAINSVNKFGGKIEDYEPIHSLMDWSTSAHAKMAHRVVFHNEYGHSLVEDLVPMTVFNQDSGRLVYTRMVADQHTEEDLGFIPTLEDWDKEFDPKHEFVRARDIPFERHCEMSAEKFGGHPIEYQQIHEKMLEPKGPAGRLTFHSAFGVFIIEKLFGVYFKNTAGKVVSTRDVAEQHVLRTLRGIPSLTDWLAPIGKPWMAGSRKTTYMIVD